MPDKRRKTVEWFYKLLEANGVTYEAGVRSDSVLVRATNGRTATFTAYDLETLSRRAMTKRVERLAQAPLSEFKFVPAIPR